MNRTKALIALLLTLVIVIVRFIFVPKVNWGEIKDKIFKDELTGEKVKKEKETAKPTLSIKVLDDVNKPIEGVSIEVYDDSMNIIGELLTDKDGAVIYTFKEGIANYHYKETNVPSNYQKDETVYDVNVTEEEKTFSRTITNSRFTGALTVYTFNSNDQPVGGVTYNIYTAAGEHYYTMTSYPASGKCGVENIPIGDYYYVKGNSGEKQNFSITYPGERIEETILID